MKEKNSAPFITEDEIRSYFVNKDLQKLKIFIYDSTDSTNTRAKLFAENEDIGEGAVFIAAHQSAGRGRRGRSFDSESGMGLYITFLEPGGESLSDTVGTTVRAAVDTVDAIERISGIQAGIKWVNDIISGGKKLAGILAEGKSDSCGRALYSIVGIGINLFSRPFPEDIADIAVSLEDITGIRHSAARLAAALIELHRSEREREEILRIYRERSTVIGRRILVRRISGEEFSAAALGITDSGALSVMHEDGRLEELISAEVSVRV